MTLAAGVRVGPYEVVAPLGAGGMGEVYRARDARLGREVAVKVLPTEVASSPDRLRRFELEARAAGALNHPNLLSVLDVGTHDGSPYVVSELLEGETLRERMGSALPQRKALDLAVQIAHGLAAAHEKGIVHRDIKPENVFVTKDGRAKILDFGLAKLRPTADMGSTVETATHSADTGSGIVLGTVGYMSPEQVRGEPADHRSDIFSFGSVLYEMLARRRAFRRDTSAETMTAILREDPPALSEGDATLPPALDRVVRRCLEKRPEERFQSARDVAFAIEALSSASQISAVAVTRPTTSTRRSVLGLAALAILVGATLGVIGGRRLWRSEAPTFTRITFRRGFVYSAKFAPGGETIVYSARWEGKPLTLFTTRPGSVESSALDLPPADVVSISTGGEMALALQPSWTHALTLSGTLASVPLAGGAPRELLDDAPSADWGPNGDLAAVHWSEGKCRLERPIGKVLYSSENVLSNPRVSPRGDLVAFIESSLGDIYTGVVATVDNAGHHTILTEPLYLPTGLAWSPDGHEVWHTSLDDRGQTALRVATRSGERRVVTRLPGRIRLHDVLGDGRALIAIENLRVTVMAAAPDSREERNLSWHDSSDLVDISPDGRALVLAETLFAGGVRSATYVRGTDGSAAVRLGEGHGLALSPDGKWVLATSQGASLMLFPTRAGEARPIKTDPFSELAGASWFPDSQSFAFAARATGRSLQVFAQDLEGGHARALTPEGMELRFPLVSGAAGLIAAVGPDSEVEVFPLEGGEPKPVAGALEGDIPIQWSTDGSILYVFRPNDSPIGVFALDLSTRRRRLFKQISIADPTGIGETPTVAMTPDGRFVAYSFTRVLSDLYVVEGLH